MTIVLYDVKSPEKSDVSNIKKITINYWYYRYEIVALRFKQITMRKMIIHSFSNIIQNQCIHWLTKCMYVSMSIGGIKHIFVNK